MEIQEDRWLSNIFGYPVFKVALEAAAGELQERIRHHAAQQPAAFYYAKVGIDSVEVIRNLNAAGFYVVDVNVTLGVERGVEPAVAKTEAVPIRAVQPEDHEELLEIAESCFRYSRFHLDPLIPVAIANRIKREWVHSYLRRERGDELFVALGDRRPVGFLAALVSSTNGRSLGTIDLIGVDRDEQRNGIGQALVRRFLAHYQDRCEGFRVGTQVANVPSIRLYQKLGFWMVHAQYVLHLHARNGNPQTIGTTCV